MSRAKLAKILRATIGLLLLHVAPATAQEERKPPEVAPSQAEQQTLLAAMRQYAGDYTAKLPNFICEQTTSQFEAGKKPTHWHKGDTLTSKLVFSAGREQRTLERVNNKPVKYGARSWRTPLTTEGEFGILLSNIFDPVTETKFSWNRWDTYHDRRVAVIDYAVDRQHSTLSLSLSDLAKAVVAYSGSVYADPATGAIWRITNGTAEIPAEVQTRSIATTVDYGEVSIGGGNYLLPVQANVLLVTGTNNIRNEIVFQGYRKFEAESSITFTPADEGAKQDGKPPEPSPSPLP